MNIRIYGLKDSCSHAHRFFQALADTTRLRCLMLMVAEEEVCVCEMTHALGEIQPKVSRHLAALRAAGFILDRREAQWMYYRLHPDLPAWMHEVLQTTCPGAGRANPVLHRPRRAGGHAQSAPAPLRGLT
jgi:DNA-binding transcriptional ArsR family regulator